MNTDAKDTISVRDFLPQVEGVKILMWRIPFFKVIDHSQDGIYILLNGSLTLRNSVSNITLTPNELIFIRRGCYAASTDDYLSNLLWIPLPRDFMQGFLQRFGALLADVTRTEENAFNLLRFHATPQLTLCTWGLYGLTQYDSPKALAQFRIEELLFLLLTEGKSGPQLMSIFRKYGNRQFERLQQFMNKHFLKDWTLEKYAKELGMGLTTFKSIFFSTYGVSPRHWISEQRILYAHQLLMNSNMSIVDIAMDAGFSSQSYFTQSYRRRFGRTPSQARLVNPGDTA